jgi:hypothetical protein
VLAENQAAARLEHAAHAIKSRHGFKDGAKRIGDQHSVYTAVIERDFAAFRRHIVHVKGHVFIA